MTPAGADAPAAGSRASTGDPSVRVRLARLAREAALEIAGVAAVDTAAATRSTVSGAQRLPGVTCAALPDGGYGVTLYLTARPVALRPLGDHVRQAVFTAAAVAGLSVELAVVDVVICDLGPSG